MADFTATAQAFPSSNDLFGTGVAGDGINMREGSLTDKWIASALKQNFIISGFALPGSSGSLTLAIPSGAAYLAGRYLNVSATNVTCTASATNHIYLKITRDAGLNINAVKYEVNTTGVAPADSIKLGTAVCSGGAVTGTTDARLLTQISQAMLNKPSVGTPELIDSGVTQVKLAKPSVGTPELKMATGSATTGVGIGGIIEQDYTLNDCSFAPMVSLDSPASATAYSRMSAQQSGDPGNTVARFHVSWDNSSGAGPASINGYVRWRYLTASDNPEVWILKDPATGLIVSSWWSDDPVPGGGAPIVIKGLEAMRLSSADIERLTIPSAAIDQAEALIRDRKLNEANLAFRALAIHAGDDAPASWLLTNCKLDQAGTLAELTPAELDTRAAQQAQQAAQSAPVKLS